MLTNSFQFVKVYGPMAHFGIHTLTFLISRTPMLIALKHCDSLNKIARQNRTKGKETLESIACEEGQGFVLQSNRA